MKKLKELFGRSAEIVEPEPFYVPSGIEGIAWKVLDHEAFMSRPIYPHQATIDLAREDGIELLSFADIDSQLGESTLSKHNWVLFDVPPRVRIGNHWNFITYDLGHNEVWLEFCEEDGITRYSHIEPFSVPYDLPFFTGVTVVDRFDSEKKLVTIPEFRKRQTNGMSVEESNQGLDFTAARYWTKGSDYGMTPAPIGEFLKPSGVASG